MTKRGCGTVCVASSSCHDVRQSVHSVPHTIIRSVRDVIVCVIFFVATDPSNHFVAFALIGIILNQTTVGLNCFRCRRCVVIVPPPLVLTLAMPKQQYALIHTMIRVPMDSVDASFPSQRCPAIVPRSLLRRVR